jgi:hypothetical protein
MNDLKTTCTPLACYLCIVFFGFTMGISMANPEKFIAKPERKVRKTGLTYCQRG